MRQLLKIATSVFFALLLTVGVAFGQSNNAVVEQHAGTSGELEARISQSGFHHNAVIRQGVVTTTNRVGAKKSDATIRQRGANAEAVILQGRRGGFSAKSSAKINQTGPSDAEILQGVGTKSAAERNNSAVQRQNGLGHDAKIWQGVNTGGGKSTKTEANEAVQNQRRGASNRALIKQGVGSGSYAEDGLARQVQAGTNNTARILQGTGGNWATGMEAIQRQFGSGHTAHTVQTGVNSSARITQSN